MPDGGLEPRLIDLDPELDTPEHFKRVLAAAARRDVLAGLRDAYIDAHARNALHGGYDPDAAAALVHATTELVTELGAASDGSG